MLKFLRKKARGVIAVEWVICAPFALMITFFSIMVLIFTLDFHLISKNCSNLVSDLNMGDTGYTQYSSMGGSEMIQTRSYSRNNYKLGGIGSGETVRAEITNDGGGYFHNTARYFITELNDHGGFTAPYCELTGLECRVYDEYGAERTGFNVDKGVTESGDMVVVTVNFNYCGIIPVEIQSFGFIN